MICVYSPLSSSPIPVPLPFCFLLSGNEGMPSDSDGTTASPDLTEDEGSTTADDSNSDSESDATSSNASEQDGAEVSSFHPSSLAKNLPHISSQ